MSSQVCVHLLPRLFEPEVLRGGVAVVIDILRASTTIVHALAAQATGIIPCGEIEAAREVAGALPAGSVLLGGERHGERIAGFDLDNSPLKYQAAVLAGKTLVFTTTNGTRALERCQFADRVLVGAFVNRSALIDALVQDGRSVHLVCAGTDGLITAEDVLFAGSIAQAVRDRRKDTAIPDDETQLALALWQTVLHDQSRTLQVLRDSRGGLNLIELGYDQDIVRCATYDLFGIVPEFDRTRRLITATGHD